ncbi:hypothetical protein K437DRAFT_259758 [Tilletiaria anomala UBC 951]|uniref:Uncharacterized protein n=1 Tax=Tilletiaria anomala (strain ATCC 24038 / CBS 436.72 / UBC 951) TaxID=1037660 RepID=A0A066VFN6_TILAU|nr:uncharacterized protein K437DRAFT_259758 [Tilletiaria anomala UBC 951]KDN37584.1 hypothetical protein K437DRAFT_259758 [Tilletiaria anomala UBC 951]
MPITDIYHHDGSGSNGKGNDVSTHAAAPAGHADGDDGSDSLAAAFTNLPPAGVAPAAGTSSAGNSSQCDKQQQRQQEQLLQSLRAAAASSAAHSAATLHAFNNSALPAHLRDHLSSQLHHQQHSRHHHLPHHDDHSLHQQQHAPITPPPPPPPAPAPGADTDATGTHDLEADTTDPQDAIAAAVAAAAATATASRHHGRDEDEGSIHDAETDNGAVLGLEDMQVVESADGAAGEHPHAAVSAELPQQAQEGEPQQQGVEGSNVREAGDPGSLVQGPGPYTFPTDLSQYEYGDTEELTSSVQNLANRHGFRVTRQNMRRATSTSISKNADGSSSGSARKRLRLEDTFIGGVGEQSFINIPNTSEHDADFSSISVHIPSDAAGLATSSSAPTTTNGAPASVDHHTLGDSAVDSADPDNDPTNWVRVVYFACSKGTRQRARKPQGDAQEIKARKKRSGEPGQECHWQLKADRRSPAEPFRLTMLRAEHNHDVRDALDGSAPHRLQRRDKARVWELYFRGGFKPKEIAAALSADTYYTVVARQIEDYVYNWKAQAPEAEVARAGEQRAASADRLRKATDENKNKDEYARRLREHMHALEDEASEMMQHALIVANPKSGARSVGANPTGRLGRHYKGNTLRPPGKFAAADQASDQGSTPPSASRDGGAENAESAGPKDEEPDADGGEHQLQQQDGDEHNTAAAVAAVSTSPAQALPQAIIIPAAGASSGTNGSASVAARHPGTTSGGAKASGKGTANGRAITSNARTDHKQQQQQQNSEAGPTASSTTAAGTTTAGTVQTPPPPAPALTASPRDMSIAVENAKRAFRESLVQQGVAADSITGDMLSEMLLRGPAAVAVAAAIGGGAHSSGGDGQDGAAVTAGETGTGEGDGGEQIGAHAIGSAVDAQGHAQQSGAAQDDADMDDDLGVEFWTTLNQDLQSAT